MNLKYDGTNALVKSAVNRAELILRSSFFQEQLLKNFSVSDAEKIRSIISSIGDQNSESISITTFWNPLKKESIIEPKNNIIGLNTALLKKSRHAFLQQIIKNYSKLLISKLTSNPLKTDDQILDRQIKMITQAYA